MTSNVTGLILVVAAATAESVAQMALKIGAAGGPRILSAPYRQFATKYRVCSSAAPWVMWGILFYGFQIVLYTLALNRLDVSVAFPLSSLCFVGVAILSNRFLGETVGKTRWLGVFFILAGNVFLTL